MMHEHERVISVTESFSAGKLLSVRSIQRPLFVFETRVWSECSLAARRVSKTEGAEEDRDSTCLFNFSRFFGKRREMSGRREKKLHDIVLCVGGTHLSQTDDVGGRSIRALFSGCNTKRNKNRRAIESNLYLQHQPLLFRFKGCCCCKERIERLRDPLPELERWILAE